MKNKRKKDVHKCDRFFREMSRRFIGLTYKDVLLLTQHSKVVPAEADLRTKFSRNVGLNIPLCSSPMDTVTMHKMAIAMAMAGGIGIIHRSLTPKEQASEVARVKHYLTGRLISKPICVGPSDSVKSVLRMIEEKNYTFRSFPVVDKEGKLAGLLTGNDFDFCLNATVSVDKIMTLKDELITVREDVDVKRAFKMMHKKQKKILPMVDSQNKLLGIYVFTDLKRQIMGINKQYNVDAEGRLCVGAAVGVSDDDIQRAELLVEKGVNVLVIDTAHGDTEDVIRTLKKLKALYPQVDVVAGNVSTAAEALSLVRAGADGIRVGQGPGSICTTRIISGSGRAQLTAVAEIALALRGMGVPIIADGGIKYSGDIVKALGAGADSVMIGSLFAGTSESPGRIIMIGGGPFKVYRGMGSLGAMEDSQASRDKYLQKESKKGKLVPEGVEGAVPFKGDVAEFIYQLMGGLRSGMGYSGAKNIKVLQKKALFEQITEGAQQESHPSVIITRDAPNYKKEES
ncbi:MAG: IMP dehydrogenase [Parcubacteria group bacterium]